MLHDRLGNRIEAGCILYDVTSGTLRVVLEIEPRAPVASPDWDVVCFIFEVGRSYWCIGSRPVIGLRASSHFLRKVEVVGGVYESPCNGEHDYDDAIDWLHPHATSVCLRCGYVRHNTPPLS